MLTIIEMLFASITLAFFIPFLFGIFYIFKYKVIGKKHEKRLLKLIACITVIFVFGLGVLLATSVRYVFNTKLGIYIAVICYTAMLGFISSETVIKGFYLKEGCDITNNLLAFKRGYTNGSSCFLFCILPLNIIIYSFYLFCLIISQLPTITDVSLSVNLIEFCKYHEYGILVLFAVKELIKNFFPDIRLTKKKLELSDEL